MSYQKLYVLDRASCLLDAQLLSSLTVGTFTGSSGSLLGTQSWNMPGGYKAVLTIEQEQILVSAMSIAAGTITFTIDTRGYNNTTAATHAAGTVVEIHFTKAHFDNFRDALVANDDSITQINTNVQNGLIPQSNVTTISSAPVHIIAGDQTLIFVAGRTFLFKVLGVWYRSLIRSSSFGGGNTTINITGDGLPGSGTVQACGFEFNLSVNAPENLHLVKNMSTDPAQNPPAGYNWLYFKTNALTSMDSSGNISVYSTGLPAGMVAPYGGSSAPAGWLLCDGTAVSRATYSTLFAIVSTTYGVGDGSTTFNLPDLRSNVPVGRKAGDSDFGTLGAVGGEKTHVLTTGEMPAHTHNIPGASGTSGGFPPANALNAGGWSSGSAGGGGAHNNLQPFIVLNFIIKI